MVATGIIILGAFLACVGILIHAYSTAKAEEQKEDNNAWY